LSYYALQQLFDGGFLSQSFDYEKNHKYNFNSLLKFFGCNLTQLILYGFELEEIKKSKGLKENTSGLLEFSITPNRNDVSNYVGFIAEQDLLLCIPEKQKSPFYKKSLQPLYKRSISVCNEKSHKSSIFVKIGFQTQIKNLNCQDSPLWLKKELNRQDCESINLLSDLAKYSILKWGQPIEFYDLDKIKNLNNNEDIDIDFRYSNEGESINIGKKIKLNNKFIVLTQNNKPLAIPGVYIPDEITVDAETKNVIIQCFVYDSLLIKNEIQKLGLTSDNAKLNEKGVNPTNCAIVFQRILRLLNTKIEKEEDFDIISYNLDYKADWFNKIKLYYQDVTDILGSVKLDQRRLYRKEIINSLNELKLDVINITPTHCTVCIPAHRSSDLKNSADIIEDIARIYSFDNFNSQLPITASYGSISREQEIMNKSRDFFISTGFTEFYSYSLVSSIKSSQINLTNPLSLEYSTLRTTLIPNLTKHYINNSNKGNQNTSVFEIGRLFNERLNTESTFLSGIFGGRLFSPKWDSEKLYSTYTWFEAKEEINNFFNSLNIEIRWEKIYKSIDPIYHPNATAYLYFNNNKIGIFTQIHPLFASKNKISNDIFMFEINLSNISYFTNQLKKQNRYKAFSLQPIIKKDLSFQVPIETTHLEFSNYLKKTVNKIDNNRIVRNISLFDTFVKNDNKGKIQNLGFTITFQDKTKTLLNNEIDELVNEIFKSYNIDF
jgi:phenylalanyl-tRNA synthetase beta chain